MTLIFFGLLTGVLPLAAQNVLKGSPGSNRMTTGYANSWAVVIGINAYENVPRLTYAVADAQAVSQALQPMGFPLSKIRLLIDRQATRSAIERTLYRDFAMGPEDRLFVYFAGHGETLPIKGGEEGFLLPVDADPHALAATAIAMDDLKRIGQRVKAKHVLFVMDACFSGFAATRDASTRDLSDEYIETALREPVVQVLAAGRKGERAIEEDGHGLFTRRLLDGLRGLADPENRGFITAAQLAAWIEPRVVRDSKGRMTPQYGRLDGEGQFIFLRAGESTSLQGRSPSSGSVSEPERVKASIEGSWAGTILRRNDSGYAVALTIARQPAGGLMATVVYGDGMCTGSLVLLERRDEVFLFKETVGKGGDRVCFTGGTVQLKRFGDAGIQLDRFDIDGRHQGSARLATKE